MPSLEKSTTKHNNKYSFVSHLMNKKTKSVLER